VEVRVFSTAPSSPDHGIFLSSAVSFIREAAIEDLWQRGSVRTRLGICRKKNAYPSEEEAMVVARRSELPLRSYRCDRCRRFHLTSRTKGKRMPRRDGEPL